jgi:hypothetical protein
MLEAHNIKLLSAFITVRYYARLPIFMVEKNT